MQIVRDCERCAQVYTRLPDHGFVSASLLLKNYL